MVWFSEDVVTTEMILDNYLATLNCISLDNDSRLNIIDLIKNSNNNSLSTTTTTSSLSSLSTSTSEKIVVSRTLEIQRYCAQCISSYLASDGLVIAALNYAMINVEHIMEPSRQRLLFVFFSMMNYSVKQLIEYDSNHSDFPLAVNRCKFFLDLFYKFIVLE